MEYVENFLEERKISNTLRSLKPSSKRSSGFITIDRVDYLDFSSNDYLGLSCDNRLKEAAIKAADEFGVGSSGSRLLSGDSVEFHKLEQKVAEFKNKESALIFNSGYQANISIISALCGKKDAIFADKLSHASLIDGAMLSKANLFRFKHNDVDSLEYLLKKHRSNFDRALIVTESLFSMDGDIAPLGAIVDLKNRFKSQILVDEAHATGVYGQDGSGLLGEMGLSEEVDLVVGTFSKALGSFGAYLATSNLLKDFLVNSARGFIYSTALPPTVIGANHASIEIVKSEKSKRELLKENASLFRQSLVDLGFEVRGSSQIVPLILGSSDRAVDFSQRLKDVGFLVLPIRQPTVAAKEARLRFSITAAHSRENLRDLIDAISKLS